MVLQPGGTYSRIIDGHPNTDGDTELFLELPIEHQKAVLEWIKTELVPRKTPNFKHTSYGLKHYLERQTTDHIYMTNNQFKDAMLAAGYKPVDEKDLNWCYCISEKSPCFKKPYYC